eukprot:Tamp_31093.p3 GENE.Tamp_31093~~Tamp_31093.p3  ORF type:complete len:116 (-),score=7.08 Tamp_31093:14-361(-)
MSFPACARPLSFPRTRARGAFKWGITGGEIERRDVYAYICAGCVHLLDSALLGEGCNMRPWRAQSRVFVSLHAAQLCGGELGGWLGAKPPLVHALDGQGVDATGAVLPHGAALTG